MGDFSPRLGDACGRRQGEGSGCTALWYQASDYPCQVQQGLDRSSRPCASTIRDYTSQYFRRGNQKCICQRGCPRDSRSASCSSLVSHTTLMESFEQNELSIQLSQ